MIADIQSTIRQSLGRRVRTARVFRGLTRADLAREAQISAQHLRRIEVGDISPTVDEIESLAAILRLPVAHFVDDCVLCGSAHGSKPIRSESTGWFA